MLTAVSVRRYRGGVQVIDPGALSMLAGLARTLSMAYPTGQWLRSSSRDILLRPNGPTGHPGTNSRSLKVNIA